MKTHTDDALIALVLAGNKDAYRWIVERYQASIYRFCLSLTGQVQDAEDAASETFIKAYTKLGDYRPEGQFSSWLFTIAYRTSLDLLRARNRRAASPLEEAPEPRDHGPGPLDHALDDERNQALYQALSQLKPDQRAIISLFYYQDLSYDEIAQVLHISKGTVASKLNRSRERLKRLLKEGANHDSSQLKAAPN